MLTKTFAQYGGKQLRQSKALVNGMQKANFAMMQGSFELSPEIQPRYFMVKYTMDNKKWDDLDAKKELRKHMEEHAEKLVAAKQSQKIVLEGSMLDETKDVFYIWHGKDEREPHSYLKMDPYFQAGLVKKWSIEELDLIHGERDDELMVMGRGKF